MARDRVRAGLAPDQAETPSPAERQPGQDELRQRLDRLDPSHPSAPRYAARDAADTLGGHVRAEGGIGPERRHGLGWDAPQVKDHPQRPEPDAIRVPGDRGRHILDGDGPGTLGGGHRHGTGRPGKTEFPASWSDSDVIHLAKDAARHPDQVRWQVSNCRWLVDAERENVRIWAVVLPDGKVHAAWPESGGSGVRQNPKAR